MKTYTKLQLIAMAVTAFAQNKEVNTVHATEDGQVFYDENRANLHASSTEKKLKVYPISRGEVEQYEAANAKKATAATSGAKETTGNKGGKKDPKKDAKTEGAGTEGTGAVPGTEGSGTEGAGTDGDGAEGAGSEGAEGAGTQTEK